jgi:hypothetical protein
MSLPAGQLRRFNGVSKWLIVAAIWAVLLLSILFYQRLAWIRYASTIAVFALILGLSISIVAHRIRRRGDASRSYRAGLPAWLERFYYDDPHPKSPPDTAHHGNRASESR